jgi:hypothetical protein
MLQLMKLKASSSETCISLRDSMRLPKHAYSMEKCAARMKVCHYR